MASSNNLASLEPWSFRSSSSFTDSWISEVFARETETFTKALQQSFSTNTAATEMLSDTYLVKTESVPTGSVSDPDMFPKRRNTVTNGKITKRKSRASKRSPTTFIAADPSNFRQMVQQVTGIQFGDAHVPVISVLKPEPQRPAVANRIQNYSLPTLDTSSQFLLDNNRFARVDRETAVAAPPAVVEDFGSFHNFPTLESWRVM